MPTNDQNSGPEEEQEDPELDMMDPLTDDIEKNLQRDLKRVRQDKVKMARQGQRLKKADFDFEVDSATKTSDDTTEPFEEKNVPKNKSTKTQPSSVNNQEIKKTPSPQNTSTPSKQTTPNTNRTDSTQTAEPSRPSANETPENEETYYQDTNEVADQDQTLPEASDDEVENKETDNKTLAEDAAPQNIPPEVTTGGAATGDNPLDPTKQGQGGAATGDNPLDPMKQGSDKAQMAQNAGVDTGETGQEIDPRTGKPIKSATGKVDPKTGKLIDDKDAEKKKINEEEIKRQLNASRNKNKYQSPGTATAADMASAMSGGGSTPKPATMGGAQKPGFQAGGGPSDPSQFDAQKKPGGVKGAAQKAGAAVGGAMDKGRQAADAVKRQVDSVKNAAKNIKDKLGAPGRKLAAAKQAISNFLDDMNPIKRLKKLFKSVSITEMIGGLVRLLLTAKGFGTFVRMFDKLIKEENANRCYTCCVCSNCCIGALAPFLPIILVILAIAAASS